ncbi:hypothetical protein LAh6_68 [Aeromonas phage LAh_6]|uniref:Uncharacterized protein n=2 Tax=Lahexavirus TaxID=2843411 RepID=A0A513ZZX3_9CAUD|nr:hypothetical protein HWC30_gp068 [Aeromonas phage LAh_6]QDH46561.1 hypothetical protein LAh6_68 [Aeromonas phage LAh_6]
MQCLEALGMPRTNEVRMSSNILINSGYHSTNYSYNTWSCIQVGAKIPTSHWEGQAFFKIPDTTNEYTYGLRMVELFSEASIKLKNEYGKDLSSGNKIVTFDRRRIGSDSWAITMTVKEYDLL